MIQAPQLQYMPTFQPMSANGQQGAVMMQNAMMPNNLQMPNAFYNYPTSSCYAQPQTSPKSQFNGVNIEILNPQGQGITPQNGYQMPAQFVPVQQNPIAFPGYPVNYPAAQAIVNPPVNNIPQVQPQQAAVVQPETPQVEAPVVPQPQIITPVAPQQAAPVQPAVQEFQEIPAQVMTLADVQTPAVPQQEVPVQTVAPEPQPVAPQVAQDAPVQPEVQVQTPVVEEPQTLDPALSVESFAGRINSSNPDEQKAAIEEVAEAVKNDKNLGPILLDTQIFDSLVNVINTDTSALQGPTPEINELRQKAQEELTPDELAKATTPTPLEKAEMNKQYALYTIAFLQNRLNAELQERGGAALELKDLPCIDTVINTVKENPNPMLRISAISALSHIARPEYKADLTTIFDLAKADEDANVKDAATTALGMLA